MVSNKHAALSFWAENCKRKNIWETQNYMEEQNKVILIEICCKYVEWVEVASDMVKQGAFVNTMTNL